MNCHAGIVYHSITTKLVWQASHTRWLASEPESTITTLEREQLSQKISPHLRQWGRRLKKEKVASQRGAMQAAAAESGTQLLLVK